MWFTGSLNVYAYRLKYPAPPLREPHRITAQEPANDRVVIPRLHVDEARGGVGDVAREPLIVDVLGRALARLAERGVVFTPEHGAGEAGGRSRAAQMIGVGPFHVAAAHPRDGASP